MTIGIVTLSFNQGLFLPEAVQSLYPHNCEKLLHVVVDPGSTDNSRKFLACHRSSFHQLILEPDQGPADGLNKGFEKLHTDIFGYLNADDRYSPGTLDYVTDFFESNPHVDVLFGGIRVIEADGRARVRMRRPDIFDLRSYAYQLCYVYQPGTFFRRSAFNRTNGFNVKNTTCWDGELIVDLAIAQCTFDYTRRVLGEFRIHPGSLTGSKRLAREYQFDCLRIRDRIVKSGVPAMCPIELFARRVTYKFNVFRHLSYVLP